MAVLPGAGALQRKLYRDAVLAAGGHLPLWEWWVAWWQRQGPAWRAAGERLRVDDDA